MTRTNIHFDEKKNELLRQIWDIFLRHGYDNTTLSLIVKELKVSKGAFYHYFPTKEACADAAVEQFAKNCRDAVASQADAGQPAAQRMKRLIGACASLFRQNEQNAAEVNTPSNTIFHLKLMAALVKALAPLYADAIAQGVAERVFEAAYPLETAQMILTLSNFYFDADLFHWAPEDMPAKLIAFEGLLTACLKAGPGTFGFLHENNMAEE